MSWNYRVVKKAYDNPESLRAIAGDACTLYGIHETYYDDSGRIQSVTVEPSDVCADTPEELAQMLQMMAEGVKKACLDYEAIPEPGATPMGGGGEFGLDEDGHLAIKHSPKREDAK